MIGQGAMQSAALGQLGSTFIADTAEHVGSWWKIQCVADCAFTALESGLRPNGEAVMGGDIENITMAHGFEIHGHFTKIELASGSVIAYEV